MEKYLRSTDIIDWKHPDIIRLANDLSRGAADDATIARRCFEWVRDEVLHSHDHQLNPVTCIASEALAYKTGYCYAKSHLLAALLRASDIPAGICYQRLSRDDKGAPYVLHGLNAVYLKDFGWYRMDARGNREGVTAMFDPPVERLAYLPACQGEADIQLVFADPLPIVLEALRAHTDWLEMHEHLPDLDITPNRSQSDESG